MYQKDLIRSAWKSAGLYDENDSKLQRFLKLLDDPTQCWTEMTDTCRRSFAAYKAKIVQPIMNSQDTLVHLILIRAAAESNDDEMAILEKYIAASDPVRDQAELKAIALKGVSRLNQALVAKGNLTADVLGAIATQAAAAAPAQAPPAPAAQASIPVASASVVTAPAPAAGAATGPVAPAPGPAPAPAAEVAPTPPSQAESIPIASAPVAATPAPATGAAPTAAPTPPAPER